MRVNYKVYITALTGNKRGDSDHHDQGRQTRWGEVKKVPLKRWALHLPLSPRLVEELRVIPLAKVPSSAILFVSFDGKWNNVFYCFDDMKLHLQHFCGGFCVTNNAGRAVPAFKFYVVGWGGWVGGWVGGGWVGVSVRACEYAGVRVLICMYICIYVRI